MNEVELEALFSIAHPLFLVRTYGYKALHLNGHRCEVMQLTFGDCML